MINTSISCEDINKQCCCFNLRKVSRAVTQHFDRYLEVTGIRATQFTLLVELYSTISRGKTLTEIADNLVMDRTTLTRNLKPLEKSGFITTTRTIDRRSKAYVLTETGEQKVEQCIPLWSQAQASIVDSLGSEPYVDILEKLSGFLRITHDIKSNKA